MLYQATVSGGVTGAASGAGAGIMLLAALANIAPACRIKR